MRQQRGSRLPALRSSKRVALCILVASLFAVPLLAQKPRMTYKSGQVAMLPATPDDRVVVDKGDSKPQAKDKKTCSIQPFPGIANGVSVTTLQIPPKAEKEYEQACAALKNNQLPEAEQHLHKATNIYPQYVAGWVMLGQVLEARQQATAAHDACSRAASADATYLPAYLCLAEIAGREQQWHDVLSLTSRALELDPVSDAYAYFFSAIAYFNLNQLLEAEKNALQAEVIDRNHDEPLLQFLLSQIYEAKHDSTRAAAYLRTYRELAPHSQGSATQDKDLAEARTPK